MNEYFDKGIHVVISSQKMIPDELLNASVKNRSRLHYMMANIDIANKKLDRAWALLEDPEGNIAREPDQIYFLLKMNNFLYSKTQKYA